jgi:hypothetical protein
MKIRTFVALSAALVALMGVSTQAAEMTKLSARSGSKMRVEGTSNIHDWQVESPLIGGSIDVGQNFPMEQGQSASPGKVDAKGEAFVTVRSLKSIEKDGKPYSDKMDEIMYEKLDLKTPRITFKITELTLKEAAKSKDEPYIFDAKGEVTVAGVSKEITMPVKVLPMADKKIKISGVAPLKMSAFKIEPPAPKIALGLIKTADDVKVIFDWVVAPAKPSAK